MSRSLSLIVIALVLGFVAQPAHAVYSFGIVGNASLMNTKVDPAPTVPTSAKLGLGLGAILSFDLIPAISLETGLFYNARKVSQTETGGTVEMGFKYLQIPVVARYWVIPMFNLGAGLYYASAMGDVSTTLTPTGGTAVNQNTPYDQAGLDKSDMGLILTAGTKLPLGGMSLIGNINYLMGMKDLYKPAQTGKTLKWSGLEIQAGVAF